MIAAPVAAQSLSAIETSSKTGVTERSTDHLKIRYARAVSARADGAVSFVLEIEPRRGMHVYAPGADDYQVISIAIPEQPLVRPRPVQYPPSEVYHFQPLNERIPVYQKPFKLILEVRLEDGARPLTVKGRLDYQACNDKVCFAPVSIPLSWTVSLDPPVR